jgi:hypothetical protein
MSTLFTIFAYFIGIASGVIAWKTYSWFNMSLFDHATTSGFDYFMKRLGAFLIVGYIGGWLSFTFFSEKGLIELKSNSSISSNSNESTSNTSVTQQDSGNLNLSNSNKSTSNKSDMPKNNDDISVNKSSESQYDGDDPIIRSRLGLPPKN